MVSEASDANPLGLGHVYQITQLLPAEGDDRLYRDKSADEPHERVAKEIELERVI
jgi:hypothetical protein